MINRKRSIYKEMLSRIKNVVHFSSSDPSMLIVGFVLVFLSVIFILAFQYAEFAARLLPALAVALCISLLLVPQKHLSVLLMVLAGMSVPFAHFALVVAGGEGIQWIHLFGALLIIHMLARMLLGSKIKIAPSMPWVLGLVLASVISLIGAANSPGAVVLEFWKSEVQLIFAVMMYLAITQVRIENKYLLLSMKVLILVSVGVALFGFYQLPARFFGWPAGVLKLTNPSLSGSIQSADLIFYMVRSSSIFSEPSYYGHYMNGMIVLSLVAALHRPKFFGKAWITWVILGVQVLGLLVSFAMSSFYILTLVFLFFFLSESTRHRTRIIAATVLLAVAGGILLILIEALSGFPVSTFMVDRAEGIWLYLISGETSYLVGPESIFQRLDTARIAMNVWFDNPVFGVGLGGYPLVSHLYGDYNPQGFSANALVNTFAEMGLVGVTALIGIIISSLVGLWRIFNANNSKVDEPDNETADIKLLSRMVFFLVLVEMLYFHVQGSFFWPSVWYYLGLGGLVAIKAEKHKVGSTEKA